ncbi:hypothetical protein [Glycomyces albidus]|uniref:Uncharacterized protein n=1 Tax=Glycomyces albidus TaxID=2656774 RepID=A0A6L5GF98_9ACTN|nr:hypothetical protein [Glycomyces albidus]MQM28384.1 hypothetical protein [Glycomyces albidus]
MADRNPDEVALLTALITKGSENPKAIAARIGPARAYALAGSALAIAASRRFPAGSTYAEVAAYSRGLADRFPNGADLLKPTVVEAMIRSGRGEEGLLDGLNTTLVQQLLLMLPYVLMTDQELSAEEKAAFIEEAISLTDEGDE